MFCNNHTSLSEHLARTPSFFAQFLHSNVIGCLGYCNSCGIFKNQKIGFGLDGPNIIYSLEFYTNYNKSGVPEASLKIETEDFN